MKITVDRFKFTKKKLFKTLKIIDIRDFGYKT